MAVLWNLSWAGLVRGQMPLAGPLEHVTLQTGSASLGGFSSQLEGVWVPPAREGHLSR